MKRKICGRSVETTQERNYGRVLRVHARRRGEEKQQVISSSCRESPRRCMQRVLHNYHETELESVQTQSRAFNNLE